MNKSLFEQNGGTYSEVGDYRVPDLTMPGEAKYHIRILGQQRLDYLKSCRRVLYVSLLT